MAKVFDYAAGRVNCALHISTIEGSFRGDDVREFFLSKGLMGFLEHPSTRARMYYPTAGNFKLFNVQNGFISGISDKGIRKLVEHFEAERSDEPEEEDSGGVDFFDFLSGVFGALLGNDEELDEELDDDDDNDIPSTLNSIAAEFDVSIKELEDCLLGVGFLLRSGGPFLRVSPVAYLYDFVSKVTFAFEGIYLTDDGWKFIADALEGEEGKLEPESSSLAETVEDVLAAEDFEVNTAYLMAADGCGFRLSVDEDGKLSKEFIAV